MKLNVGEHMELISYLRYVKNLFPEYKREREFMSVFMVSSPDAFSELRTTHLLRLILKARNFASSKGMATDPPPDIFHNWEGVSEDIMSADRAPWDSFRGSPKELPSEDKKPEEVEVSVEELSVYFDSLADMLGSPGRPGEKEFLTATIKSFAEALNTPVVRLVQKQFSGVDIASAAILDIPIDRLRLVGYGAFKTLMGMFPDPPEESAPPLTDLDALDYF